MMNTDASAKKRPGQTLRDAKAKEYTGSQRAAAGTVCDEASRGPHLRPKPKANSGSRTSGLSLPFFMNRSGSNLSGSGYARSSREIALRQNRDRVSIGQP